MLSASVMVVTAKDAFSVLSVTYMKHDRKRVATATEQGIPLAQFRATQLRWIDADDPLAERPLFCRSAHASTGECRAALSSAGVVCVYLGKLSPLANAYGDHAIDD